MPAIYTDEWYKAMFELANSRDDLAEKAPPGEWKVVVEVTGNGKSPYIPVGEERIFYIRLRDGKVVEYHQSPERVPGKGLHYRITGPAHIFEGIAAGILDPVEAGLNGSLAIRGDMRLFIQNAELVNVIFEIYTQTGLTEWPKGKPPYE
jgi:hypothetical protein